MSELKTPPQTSEAEVADHPLDQTLLKADAVTLLVKAEPDGVDARVILPGQSVELRWDHGRSPNRGSKAANTSQLTARPL